MRTETYKGTRAAYTLAVERLWSGHLMPQSAFFATTSRNAISDSADRELPVGTAGAVLNTCRHYTADHDDSWAPHLDTAWCSSKSVA